MSDRKDIQDLTDEEFEAIIGATINREVYGKDVKKTGRQSFLK